MRCGEYPHKSLLGRGIHERANATGSCLLSPSLSGAIDSDGGSGSSLVFCVCVALVTNSQALS